MPRLRGEILACVPEDGTVDSSSVHAFASVSRLLKEDTEPGAEAWAALDVSPGYRVLFEREFDRDTFREAMRVVFKPSRADDLAAVRDQFPYSHYAGWAADNLDNFDRLLETLEANLRPCAALGLARPYLPSGIDWTPPAVAIAVFAPDARGYDPIVFDLSLAELYTSEQFGRLAAHEFHHNLRAQLIPTTLYEPNGTEAAVLAGLDQLQAEGVADLINVPGMLNASYDHPMLQGVQQRYRSLLATAPDSLRAFDRAIEEIAVHGGDAEEAQRRVRAALPLSAHPTGFHMARLIERELGREPLVRHIADPFAFVEDYEEAAKRAEARDGSSVGRLGPASLRYLSALRDRIQRAAG